MDPVTVKIGGQEVALEAPTSYALQWEIWTFCAAHPGPRGRAAALGACWPAKAPWPGETKRNRRPTFAGCGYDLGAFGGAVIDSLATQGVRIPEIAMAGVLAYNLIAQIIPTEAEVKAAEDFSPPPPGG